MAVHVRILLILTGLTGIHSITTVSKMSVKAGDSISIPCLYDSQYRNHVKYFCKGYHWNSCSPVVKTNQPDSEKFSISDDKNQTIFTMTIKALTYKDNDYWCAVEINGGADIREYFHMSVTGDTPSLYVDHQEITGFNGENLTINCYHRNSGEMKWCRLGSSCVTGSSESIDGARVSINTSVPNVFTVTMSGLKTGSSGWYWCVNGDLQMPVHVTVTEKPTTTMRVHLTTSFPDKTPNTVQGEQHRDSMNLKSLIIPLSLLIFVMVILSIWLMLKKHKQTKAASSALIVAEEEVTYSTVKKKRKNSRQTSYTDSDGEVMYSSVVTTSQKSVLRAEEEVSYSTVEKKRKNSRQTSYTESDVDVMYSSVVTKSQNSVQKVEANDGNVMYSTLA